MRRIGVVTDSSACLPADVCRRLGITTVPISVHLPAEEDVRDGQSGASERVFGAMADGQSLKSEAPSAADYLHAMDEAGGEGLVVVTPAVEFTVMYRNARLAAEVAERPVRVVDCRTAAAAHGLVVLEAARAAAAGAGLEEVTAAAEAAAMRAELCAKLDAIEPLERSGRVPSDTIARARGMRIRPVFRLAQGTVEPLGVQQSRHAALRRLVRELRARGGGDSDRILVFHALRPDEAAELQAELGGEPEVVEFSPSMGIHTGAGVVGVAWLRRD